jgi:hypothetical protein
VGENLNGEDEGEGIWWMSFIFIYEIYDGTSCSCIKWGGEGLKGWDGGGDLTNVQCKAIQNCHSEVPLLNEYMLIKMKKKDVGTEGLIVLEQDTENDFR